LLLSAFPKRSTPNDYWNMVCWIKPEVRHRIKGMSYLRITELFEWTTVRAETKILVGAV